MNLIAKIICILFLFFGFYSEEAQAFPISNIQNASCAVISEKNSIESIINFIYKNNDLISANSNNLQIAQKQRKNKAFGNDLLNIGSNNKNFFNLYHFKKIISYIHVLHNISPNLKNVLIARAP